MYRSRGFPVLFHLWSFPQKMPVTRTIERKREAWYFTVKSLPLEGDSSQFQGPAHLRAGLLCISKVSWLSYLPCDSFLCWRLGQLSLWGVDGMVPLAAFSDRTPSADRGAGQHLGALSFPTSTGGHYSALKGKAAILKKSPLSPHLRFGGSELTHSSV